MLSFLRKLVIPPVFRDDEQTRQAGLLNTMTLALMGLALVSGPIYAWAASNPLLLLPAAMLLLGAGVARLLNRRGLTAASSVTILTTIFLGVTVAVATLGGLGGPVYAAYSLGIIAAALLLGSWAAGVMTILSIVSGYGIVSAAELGLIAPAIPWHFSDALWAGANTTFVLTGLLMMLADRHMRDAFFRLHRTQQALVESEERYMLAVRGANDGIWDWDLKHDTLYCSPRWRSVLGLDPISEYVPFRDWLDHVYWDDRARLLRAIDAHVSGQTDHLRIEYRVGESGGGVRWVLTRGLAVRDGAGNAYRMAGSHSDITERKSIEQEMSYQAHHDTLTELPNRQLLMDRLTAFIMRSRRLNRPTFAVLFIDLDRFKIVNDSLGHLVGDQLLIAASRRIIACLRPTDLAARLGGDEFAVLLDDPKTDDNMEAVARRVLEAIGQPFHVEGRELFVSCSIGIARGDLKYDTASAVLRDADVAMYRAKGSGRGGFASFEPRMHAELIHSLEIETDLRRAIEDNALSVMYQPVVAVDTSKITGFEALVRWPHPERGLVPPNDFIPVAEETGLVVALDRWVLQEACAQLVHWNASRPASEALTMSVNLSSRQFSRDDLASFVGSVITATGVSPKQLVLEITESVLMMKHERVRENMNRLRQLGVALAVDDFGTGYSSLGYLHAYPVNTLKIDRSFVSDMEVDRDKATIVKTVIGMAKSLNLHVVAEGVETQAQADSLRDMDCPVVQGFLFSKPVTASAAAELLHASPYISASPVQPSPSVTASD